LRIETLPKGARNLHGYSRDTYEHLPPHGFTEFDRKLCLALKGWNRLYRAVKQRERERERRGRAAHQRGGQAQALEVAGEGRSPPVREITGEVTGPLERAESQRVGRKQRASGSASGWRRFFKTQYGRTGQSTVPVRCTPDIAQ
jgi:hypothetical protein